MYVFMPYTGGNQAENDTHILVVAPQEYVNIYSTRRVSTRQLKSEAARFIFLARACCSALCSCGERPSSLAITWKALSAYAQENEQFSVNIITKEN